MFASKRSNLQQEDKAEVTHVEDGGVHDPVYGDDHMGKQFANDADGSLVHIDEAASKRLTRKVGLISDLFHLVWRRSQLTRDSAPT